MSEFEKTLTEMLKKPVSEASDPELFRALTEMCRKRALTREAGGSRKKLYYISAEFLIGKLLSNNLINLGWYREAKETLERNGKDLGRIEELETEPSLGNGGLGRLAACFLDSIATLGLSGDGIGLNYHLGLFKQKFEDCRQLEEPDPWMGHSGWLIPTGKGYDVSMAGKTYHSTMYDLAVTGYEGRTNRLHLFDLDTVDDSIVHDGIAFDKKDISRNLTLCLYPDDSDEDGRKLRVYQEYFMVSNAAHLILEECIGRGSNLHDLPEYAVIQINDTHPTMVIPELIRQLMERGIGMDEAVGIIRRCCAYTNHTILSEALEKWPLGYLKEIVPQLVPIIEILDDRIRRQYDDESVSIIDRGDTVHMAHIDLHYGFSVNGVAELHTEILKHSELANFYRIYPEKFNNKTNGITFRRWLLSCNPELSDFIRGEIGDDFIRESEKLENFRKVTEDADSLQKLLDIKQKNKERLCLYLKDARGLDLDPDSIFDMQAKRLHEYKRQQLNLLWVISRCQEIRNGLRPKRKVTVFFAAKAAPAYTTAKDIIHAILCLREVIRRDPLVSRYLDVVMIENYNVTLAGEMIPACDISEQISLASKEASGTGNMKFMLNGAVTLGTEDGANVEIHHLVGDENIYIFGLRSEEVIESYRRGDYCARSYYEQDPVLKSAVDFLVSDEMCEAGSREQLERLRNELIGKDWFMTFPDFKEYREIRSRMYEDYENRQEWARKMAVNIAEAGYFSSDRTIAEYNRDIWHLEQK